MKKIQPIAAYVPYMTSPGNHEEAQYVHVNCRMKVYFLYKMLGHLHCYISGGPTYNETKMYKRVLDNRQITCL